MRKHLGLVFALAILAGSALSEEPVDLAAVTRIREEGFRRSQVMNTLGELTDVIGHRLTGSPALKRANEWTRDQLAGWGLQDAHLEPWGPFGRGWSFSHASVHMVVPHEFPLIALPKAWTPGTEGEVRGAAVRVDLSTEEDLEKHKGELAGKILLLDDPRELEPLEDPLFDRYDEDELAEIVEYGVPGPRGRRSRGNDDARRRMSQRFRLRRVLNDYLTEEGVLATISVSRFDGTLVLVSGGGSREKDENPGPCALVMAAEHYNWICRLLEGDHPVELSLDVRARFHDDDDMAYNTVAEIPGTDKADELVMLGGHLDSWHGATGATDNAVGCSVAMEAVRILSAIDARPRRTIRIALWSGEEQGLLGSRAYVSDHFAKREQRERGEGEGGEGERGARGRDFGRRNQGPLQLLPGHETFSAYFNLDNGAGKVRGIYSEDNQEAKAIFEAWLRPFADLGAETVTARQTGGTDHQSFDRVGLPGFQFIQDKLDYFTRTHHTNLDVYDLCPPEDLMQASVIMAAFVYQAAMREEKMPRKPMPAEEPRRGDGDEEEKKPEKKPETL